MWMGNKRQLRIGEWKIVREDRLSWILRVFLGDTSAGGRFMFMGKRFMRKAKLKRA